METNVTKIIVKIPNCDNLSPPMNNMPIPIAKITTIAPISVSNNINKLIKDVITIGIGDSPNDLEMLDYVDFPCLIKNKNNQNLLNRDKYTISTLSLIHI